MHISRAMAPIPFIWPGLLSKCRCGMPRLYGMDHTRHSVSSTAMPPAVTLNRPGGSIAPTRSFNLL